jgi:hypothetical protein
VRGFQQRGVVCGVQCSDEYTACDLLEVRELAVVLCMRVKLNL